MNRLNAKRIGVLAASLLFGLAVAGPVSFSNIPIINSAGQPVVQIVVGSQAQPSDGVVAANIAAVIGNLAFTSTPITATVSGQSGLSCVVTTATCSVTGAQVYLGEAGVAAPTGSYGFTALIGSVLNRGITLGSPSSTKYLATTSTYGSQQGFTTTNSPPDSPYTAAGYVPTSTSVSAASNGGGLSFTTFTSGKIDNLMVIGNSQLPSLLSNSGSTGESEYLFLTGFPVYNQQTTPAIKNFAIMNAGGAYEVLFNHPIHEPYYTTGNSVNNAAFTLLGQNWTIVSYTLPAGTPSSSTVATHGGKLGLASSLVPLSTVYVGKNLTSGPFTVQLADLGTANNAGISTAAINVYYHGVLTNSSSIFPGNTVKYNVSGTQLWVKVNQTFAGLYAYQKWAKIQMYSGLYNITDGGVFNQTRDPGWNVNLLWVNTTANGANHLTDLAGIILYNTTPVTLTPGQSFTFIQNPKAYKVTFTGDTLGNNFDALSISSQYASSVNYANTPTNKDSGLGNINNITEPAQELVVTSQIPSAFNDGGFTGSTATYLLTPYVLTENANAVTANGAVTGDPVNVALAATTGYPTANFISTSNPLVVTISGFPSNTASSAQSTSVTFTSATSGNMLPTSSSFYNITQIKLNRALPGITVSAAQIATGGQYTAANVMATLTSGTTPQIIYGPLSGQTYYSTVSGASVIYNQQNGQPTSTFTITNMAPYAKAGTGPQFGFFTYNVAEINVPSNTNSQDAFSFNILNSTTGISATPMFYLNYSTTGTQNNVTYQSSSGNNVNAQVGFVSERGSKVTAIGPTQLTFNLAENVDSLQLVVGPVNATVTSAKKMVGPYSVGQSTNLPNVTIANVTAKCSVGASGSGCTVSGISNLTAVPSVSSASTPVSLNTAQTPLVVLDSNANSASTLIVIGSKFVNSVAQQIFSQNPSLDSSFNTGSVVLQAFGSNRILVAGYYANQTVQAGNQFIQALLSGSS